MFTENVVFSLQTTFSYSFNVLLSFLAEELYRKIMKSPQKVSFGSKRAKLDQTLTSVMSGPTFESINLETHKGKYMEHS